MRRGSPTQCQAATTTPSYLRAAEVADLLHVSPKTVSRWAKDGKLPFLKTLGGHRRYPAVEIRQLAAELQVQPTAVAVACSHAAQGADKSERTAG
jgi:excisionase family DNA binding protein